MKPKYIFLLPFLRCVLFIMFGITIALFTGKTFDNLTYLWTVINVVVSILTIITLVIICKKEKISYKELLGYNRNKKNIKKAIIIVIMMLVIGMGGMYGAGFLIYGNNFISVSSIMVQPLPIWLAISMLIILPAITPLAEDGLYLAFSLNRMSGITNNKYIAIFYPMILYALQHSFIPLLLDIKFIVYRFLCFLPLTIVIGIWYYKKRSIIPIMIGHYFLNLSTCVTILIMSLYPEFINMM